MRFRGGPVTPRAGERTPCDVAAPPQLEQGGLGEEPACDGDEQPNTRGDEQPPSTADAIVSLRRMPFATWCPWGLRVDARSMRLLQGARAR
eukprot:gene2713-26264_t